MTQSSTPSTPPAPQPPQPQRSIRSQPNRLHSFLVVVFRLLLLGVGGGLAALVGIAVAQFWPSRPTQDPPLVEKARQSVQSMVEQVQQLPQRWNSSPSPEAVSPSPSPTAASPSASPTPAPVSDTERQQLQTELTQLQAELQTLTQKTAQPLEDRVQALQQRIQAIQERLSSFTATAAAPAGSPTLVAPAATVTSGNQLMVTLPSDALFEADQTTLRAGTEQILNAILTDLQRYPDATIQVAAHTDRQGDAERDRLRSYEQATLVKQYLASKLGDSYHWITVGYGHSRPLADDSSPINRQRNRRVEIVIDPQ